MTQAALGGSRWDYSAHAEHCRGSLQLDTIKWREPRPLFPSGVLGPAWQGWKDSLLHRAGLPLVAHECQELHMHHREPHTIEVSQPGCVPCHHVQHWLEPHHWAAVPTCVGHKCPLPAAAANGRGLCAIGGVWEGVPTHPSTLPHPPPQLPHIYTPNIPYTPAHIQPHPLTNHTQPLHPTIHTLIPNHIPHMHRTYIHTIYTHIYTQYTHIYTHNIQE